MSHLPNILWLTSDQQRSDTIHALGNPYIDTPNLDRLCHEGVAFTRAYSQNPICTPSRASFLTGKYPSSINANINGADNLPEHCTLFPRRLKEIGYYCGLVGKLHITSAWGGFEPRMDDGYDYFENNLGSGHHLDHDDNVYAAWLSEKGVDWRDILTKDDKHDYWWYRPDAPVDLRQTAFLAERAIQFMENQTGDRPWMLSVNCYDPHPPYDAPDELVEKYLARDLPDPVFTPSDLETDKKLRLYFHQSDARPIDDALRRNKASYYGMCEIVDRHYGWIIDALDRLGLRNDTIVIFNSDHGEMLGDHGLTHKGCRFYEGLVHIPLIISMPSRFRKDYKYNGLTELTDIVPTLAELCGIPLTDTHGVSLLPVLEGRADDTGRKFVRTEYYATLEEDRNYDALRSGDEKIELPDDWTGSYACMYCDGRWKLNVFHGSSYGQLFDLNNDPQEQKNLWDEPELQSIKTDLLLKSFDASVRYTRPMQNRRGRY